MHAYRLQGLEREAALAECSLGVTLLALERHEDARATLRSSRDVLRDTGSEPLLAVVRTSLMACAAAANEWTRFDANLARALDQLESSHLVAHDLAAAAQLAAQIAARGGEKERAIAAYALAHDQWQRLGQPLRAAAVHEAMDALQS